MLGILILTFILFDMKKLLFLLVVFTSFIACSDDDEKNNENKYLYEIIVKEHQYKFGVVDSYGEAYENFIYDSNGNLLNKKTNYYVSAFNGRVSHEYSYMYDDANHLTQSSEYELSLLKYKYIYSYNSIDSISKMKVYNKDGELYETWTYEYDNTKRLIKATYKDELSNNFGYIHNYTYSGYNITDTTYNLKDGSLFGITLDEYDSHGNLTSNTWINGNTGKRTQQKGIIYEYDLNGKITKETSWGMLSDNLTYKDYTYNEDGSIQKIHLSYSYNKDESDLIYEYIYK